MLEQTGKKFKKIMAAALAICIMAVSFTQIAKAAASDDKLEEQAAQIVSQQVKANDSAKKKLKKLFAYLQKEYDYGRNVGFDAYEGW